MTRDFKGRLAICVFLLTAVIGCGGRQPEPVALPPLDASLTPAEEPDARQYAIQPGDTLRIKYLYHPELDTKVPVGPSGDITLQVAGIVRAAGLTPSQLEQLIRERSQHRLREPEISVVVASLAERTVYVGGEVRIPGAVTYRKGMTPLQAILERGGFTSTSRIDSVLRLSGTQGTRIDLTQPLRDGTPEGIELAVNDVIYVPRTFIGDVNLFVQQYIRDVLPIQPRIGAGTSF